MRRAMWGALWCAIWCAIWGSQAFGAPGVHDQKAALQAEEEAASERLDALDQHLEAIKVELQAGVKRLEGLSLSRADIELRKKALDVQLAQKEALLARRLKARYLFKQASVWQLLGTASDPLEWMRRQNLLDRVLKADLRLIQETRSARTELEALTVHLAEAASREEAARAALEAQKAEVAAEREKKSALLDSIRTKRAEFEALLAKREKQRASLSVEGAAGTTGAAGAAGAAGTADCGFAQEKGRLPWPLAGAVLRGFGAPMMAGSRARSKGLDLVVPIGTPVRAVFGGKVIYSGWYQGYGNLVIIDHGCDYHTLYGHLDAINRVSGEQVVAGMQIGESGDSGSLWGPMLYFELRQKGKPQNPAPWLGQKH